ncbi:MAG TPA: alpha/beta hydrolase-fold protein [Saprospiraceae bacterium]|nr:alpha/beta hydrolase-fold protein [Saprospiraceae bacterium]
MRSHPSAFTPGAMLVHRMLTLELFTPDDDARPVFVTGNFNGWVTRDEQFKMHKVKEGHYQYTFKEVPPTIDRFEYKYVKGGWEAEELASDGYPPANRTMESPRGKVNDVVPRWKQHISGYDPQFYPDIQIVSKRFNVPQLRRKRRISVLLPWDYASTNKRYPVLYLQDGQNLFEDTAPFGTWGVDRRLAALAQRGLGGFIVVAIDHGGSERIREFSPYDTPKWGDGLGQEYASFLAETLKPHIDSHYRTLPDRAHTGIGGSSMGGLISIYAGIMFPQVYSKFMIFSPSLWAAPKVYFEPVRFSPYSDTKIYLFAGGKEGSGMIPNVLRFKEYMENHSAGNKNLHIKLSTDPQGRHTEDRWGIEFPKAAEWLYAER